MMLEELVLPLRTESNAFKTGLKIAGSAVAALVAGMGLAIKATFDWANELDSIQDVIGGTAKEAATFNFILRKSGVSTDTFTKSMVILEKGLVNSKGKLDVTGKALKQWGINVLDANGKLKDQNMLMDEISQRYNKFATQQERVNFLTEVFGRGGAEMVDFFDTLAAEGGIAAATKKVEEFGLAIDPQRYENFNRSLEELKLIGLGLAVSFTEKVMPAIEGLMGWFVKVRNNPEVIKFLDGVQGGIDNFINSPGLQKLKDFFSPTSTPLMELMRSCTIVCKPASSVPSIPAQKLLKPDASELPSPHQSVSVTN